MLSLPMLDIEFVNKEFLWLLLVVPLMAGWYVWRYRFLQGEIHLSTLQWFSEVGLNARGMLRHSLFIFRVLSVAALIVAFSRPQSSTSWQDVNTEGIDIVLALDISTSMLAEDLQPNRLEAAKKVAVEFLDARPNDRIGLVVYAGESFTQCPLTTDHAVLKNFFGSIRDGLLEDGTAIGMGLATAVNRLKDSEAKSKVIILLTDGVNNRGSIPPLTAAEIAKEFGIRVYTVGVGTKGMARYPFPNPFGGFIYQNIEVKIDENTLQQIAGMTGGKYFRATDNKKLQSVYEEIDQLEKTKIQVTEYRKKHERFFPWVLAAGALLFMEFLFRSTVFRSTV